MKVAKSTMDLVIFLLVLFSQVVGQTVPPTGGSLSSTTDPTTCGIGSITCSTYETLASSIEVPVSSQIPSLETTTSIPAAQEGNAVSPSAIPTENVTKNQFEITTQIQKKTTTSTTTVPPTASPIAQKPLEEATLGYDNSGICACDLTSYSCDINCCCDPECSPFHRTSFSHCQVEGYPPYDNRYCYASKLVFLNNSEHILKQTQNGAFCIVRSNLAGSVLYPSHSAIISNQEFSKLWRQAHVSFWPEPSSGILLSIEKPKPYKAGSPIWVLQNNQILSLELPASGLTTTCSAMKRVPYLLPSSSQCIRKVPSTQKDCEKVSLGLIRQISGIVQSPMLINQTGMISKNNETCPGSICAPVKYFTCSGPPFENSSAESCKNISIDRMVFGLKSSICHGIVKKLMLVFHHNGTAGLEHVEAYMWLLNMSLAEEWSTQSLHQSFSVEFKWITSNSTAEKIMNSTASQAKSVMFSRSGNRGYTVGKPVIAGLKLMSNSNSSKDVTNGSRGSINFHTIELSPDSKQWITLPKSNLYGMCDWTPNQRHIVTFGEDLHVSCGVEVSLKNISSQSMCIGLRMRMLRLLLGHEGGFLENGNLMSEWRRMIAMFGNANVSNPEEWIPLLLDAQAPFSNQVIVDQKEGTDEDRLLQTCENVPLGIQLQVMHGFVGTTLKPQSRIVGASLKFTSIQDIGLACSSETCFQRNESLHLRIVSTVKFVDVSSPAVTRFAEPPAIHIRLPPDFFYPFMSSENTAHLIVYNNFLLLVSLLVLALLHVNSFYHS